MAFFMPTRLILPHAGRPSLFSVRCPLLSILETILNTLISQFRHRHPDAIIFRTRGRLATEATIFHPLHSRSTTLLTFL
ncbi:hypothetical protein SAMN05660330_00188 [Desulforhopalus singaporensis]|uniref:Uncharacterized protein n=1 Tax=Desulforhopalus singaporensis TaxID=91360 RepID=A0A1H0J862_9BACT|nr:hypothetical protein SAMN05660330_00188 [Desulforhopalus singaporensis]